MAPKKNPDAKAVAKTAAEKKPRGKKAIQEEEQEVKERSAKSQLTQMVAECSKAEATEDQKKLLEEYKSLSLRDENKRVLASRFFTDKSCQWFPSWKDSYVQQKKKSNTQVFGWLPAFMVADKLQLDLNCDIMKIILEELDQEGPEKWSDEVPLERGFKKAGLTRYFYQEGLLSSEENSGTRSNQIESTLAGKKSKGAASLDDIMNEEAKVAAEAVVLVVHEAHRDMMWECGVIETSLPKISQAMKQLKTFQAQVGALKGDKDQHQKRVDDIKEMIVKMDAFDTDVLNAKVVCENIEKTDDKQCVECHAQISKLKEHVLQPYTKGPRINV